MCVGCFLRYDQPTFKFKYYIGGLSNFLPRQRGEGDPAPWLILVVKRLGIQVHLSKCRSWLRPELITDKGHGWELGGGRVQSFSGSSTTTLMWGFFILGWRW